MLRQIEGSRAVAETVARCRPEVICAYPISPQTHIVEALSELVRLGAVTPCEYINVESEFAAMSVAIGASAAGARSYTATASQGLLYMVEAVYNAAGLGLPIVMTVANRAIGAPINIWNDHSDAMSQRDSGWIQLYAQTNQDAADLHVHRVPAGRGALHSGDGVHGRVHPDPRVRGGGRPGPGAGRRVPAGVPAAPGARPRRSRRRSARWSDRRRSWRCSIWPTAISCGRWSCFRGSLTSSLTCSVAAAVIWSPRTASRTRTRWWSRSARCSARCRTPSTSSRDQGMRIGALGITAFRPFPVDAVRAQLRRRRTGRGAGEGPGRRGRRDRVHGRARRRCPGRTPALYTVIAGLGGRPITRASLRRLFADASADQLEPLHLPRPRPGSGRAPDRWGRGS